MGDGIHSTEPRPEGFLATTRLPQDDVAAIVSPLTPAQDRRAALLRAVAATGNCGGCEERIAVGKEAEGLAACARQQAEEGLIASRGQEVIPEEGGGLHRCLRCL